MTHLRKSLLLLASTAILLSAVPAPSLAPVPGPGYVICSCQLCSTSDEVCRISPSGFSISCADYYNLHCD